MAMPSICFTAKVAKLLVLLTCVSAVPPGAQVANNAEENISIEEPLSRLIRNPASASNPAIRQLNSHIQEEFPESIVASGVSTENPGNAFLIKEIRNAFQQAMPIQSSKASRGSSALASSQGTFPMQNVVAFRNHAHWESVLSDVGMTGIQGYNM